MSQPKPNSKRYSDLISEIDQGRVKIPQFQRKFVWSIQDSARLLDSIIKGFPIGTFIFWRTQELLRSVRNIGDLTLPDTPAGDSTQYILDGQQRITSLYATVKGAKIKDDRNREVDYSKIYIDLGAKPDEPIAVTDIPDPANLRYIPFHDLLSGNLLSLASRYAAQQTYLDQLQKYSDAFKTYQFSTIDVDDAPIDVATEIFTRLNVGGEPLSVFEIMAAKTYDQPHNFDLMEKFDQLIDRLKRVDYETISSSTVLQAVSVCIVKECSKKHILNLDKAEFIAIWDGVIDALESAVEYFRTFYRIPVSQILPYNGLLVPFTYYFYRHKDKPLGVQQTYLQDYFWRTVLTSRYTSSLETNIAQDIRRIDKILADQQPEYDQPVDISLQTLEANGSFAVGAAYTKGFLCLLAAQQPLSFVDNAVVTIDNNWLKQANSKNYHHFFPRAYLQKRNVDYFRINHIANITIVDDFLNKRAIKDRAPSDYIAEFQRLNPDLDKALSTHLIDPPAQCGITTDDYDAFFEARLKNYQRELKKRLLLTPKDRE